MKGFALLFSCTLWMCVFFKTSSARTCGDLVYMYLVGTRTVKTSQI